MAKPVQGRRCPATVSGPHRPGARSPSQVAMSEPSCEREGITMSPWRHLRLVPPLVLALLVAACAQFGSSPSTATSPSGAPSLPATATPEPATVYPLTLTDDAGREVTLDAQPERIVSLAPSNTEIVCALGACDSLVGIPEYQVGYPADVAATVADLPIVVSFGPVDREAIVATEPDLVLAAGNELTSSEDIARPDRARPAGDRPVPREPGRGERRHRAGRRGAGRAGRGRRGHGRDGGDHRRGGGRGRRSRGAADLLRGERVRGHHLHRRRGLLPGVPDRDGRRRSDHRRSRHDRHRAGGSRHGRSGADRARRRDLRPDHHRRRRWRPATAGPR